MSQKDFYKNQEKQAVYHRDNFDAPVEQRRTGPDFRQVLVSNPDRISSSITRLGEVGERTKSTDELAQASRVLLNPTEVYKNGDADWSKAKWGTDAHDGFFDYFFDCHNHLLFCHFDNHSNFHSFLYLYHNHFEIFLV